MVDFIIKVDEKGEKLGNVIWNYARFLKQPLTLSMFVPSDDNGDPIERPDLEDYIFEEHPELPGNPKEYDDDAFQKDYDVYEQARERVLFEGFKLVEDWIENEHGEHLIDLTALIAFSIEDLASWHMDIELTATAIKSIYGS